MLSADQSRITVEDELVGAQAWAGRYQMQLDWLPAHLELRAKLTHPQSKHCFFLRGRFNDYRAVAPEWSFTSQEWTRDGELVFFPKPLQTPHGASIFVIHQNRGVICAPFNRLAYSQNGGPHGDWTPADWLNAGKGYVHAETLGEMLQAIFRDLSYTTERAA